MKAEKWWQQSSLSVKLIVSMTLVAVPALILLGVISYVQARKIDYNTEQNYIQSTVRQNVG
ncbi:hypothetical protein [Lacticaseibacillus daqingensis]|uniref:hypothetical protein n=1 Tax=Lacticaseibacillus daqingensis TaxID=2486014 RepID=UPI000F7793E1|nr:hypothetical protein [Lacticaseibacillus daqingensis]